MLRLLFLGAAIYGGHRAYQANKKGVPLDAAFKIANLLKSLDEIKAGGIMEPTIREQQDSARVTEEDFGPSAVDRQRFRLGDFIPTQGADPDGILTPAWLRDV